ncbi:DUF3499 family protein [Gryllotalpicola sp.]|uniref:DUF3499 family protein n=1 Tax=Gryllotalpicola sp. TaxID=1932787 RepID=UPI00262BDF17|nr:DUF3499 family protein [Gryllotalpicola sp.]
MRDRLCSKSTCSREAVATMTYDYRDAMAVVGPLSPSSATGAYDLCAEHADRLSVPDGWRVVKHAAR